MENSPLALLSVKGTVMTSESSFSFKLISSFSLLAAHK